jgi:lysozyme
MREQAVAIALALIKRFEGCRLSPYLCPAGVPTIGYGSTWYLDGTAVGLSDPSLTTEMAEELLVNTVLGEYLPKTLLLCPGLDTDRRTAALVDFCYNLGVKRLKNSTLRKRINEQSWEDVSSELLKWTMGGGRSLRGLVLRRTEEGQLIL